MKPNRKPTSCKVCRKPNCNDWMYHAELVPASQAICGSCKLKIGRHVLDKMTELVNKHPYKKSKKK
jgi:hypothetical protein